MAIDGGDEFFSAGRERHLEVSAAVGQEIRKRRELLGFDIVGLAQMVGLTSEEMTAIEAGVVRPHPDVMVALARALKCSVAVFFRGIAAPDSRDARVLSATDKVVPLDAWRPKPKNSQ